MVRGERAGEEELAGDFGGNGGLAGNGEQTVEKLEDDAAIAEGFVGNDVERVARNGERLLGREKDGRADAAEQSEG